MKPKRLTDKQDRFLKHLGGMAAGEVISMDELVEATGWSESTIGTYRRKHMLDPFLVRKGRRQFQVLRAGSTITAQEVLDAFTQVHIDLLNLTQGMICRGEHGHYELDGFVGEGAVAHVWSAFQSGSQLSLFADQSLPEEYALKIMNPRPDLLEPSLLENVRKRFAREARNGMRMEHNNVVRYRDHGDLQGHPFLAMDLADESVGDMIKFGPLGLDLSLSIIAACASGLAYLHTVSGIHRDIKPQNMLRFGDRYVVGDLGIVRWSELNTAFTSAGTITKSAVQLGSWYYMAPEQRRDPHTAVENSDVYALGISWYEMLAGRVPDPTEVGAKQFPSPCDEPLVNDLISRMVNYDPSTRPTVLQVLEEVCQMIATRGRAATTT